MADASHQSEPTTSRALHLVLAAVIALAFIGFVVGIRQGTPVPEFQPPEPADVQAFADTVPAMPYLEFDRRIHGPNAAWISTLSDLQQPDIDLFAEPQRSEEARRMVLASRAERRAFDGAPPVVPHPIDQMGTASCMACHSQGIYIGKGVRAAKMSHEYLPNCTQCHVEQTSRDLGSFQFAANTFERLDSPLGGQRAWPGAPPTIPHQTFMREDCMSCHGPTGPEPIRTTHPWQANCTQCHAPSAILDQVVIDNRTAILSALDGD